MAGSGKISRGKERAICALLTADSVPAAAEEAGVSERTLWRWLKLDEFRNAYREARGELVRHAICHVQSSMSKAVLTLIEVMESSDSPASSRVSAAKAMLEFGVKGVEIEDLAERIDQLEKFMEEERR